VTFQQVCDHPALVKIVPYDWVDMKMTEKGSTVDEWLESMASIRDFDPLATKLKDSIFITPVVSDMRINCASVGNSLLAEHLCKERFKGLQDGTYVHHTISHHVEQMLSDRLSEFPAGNQISALFRVLIYSKVEKPIAGYEGVAKLINQLNRTTFEPDDEISLRSPEIVGSFPSFEDSGAYLTFPEGELCVVHVSARGASVISKSGKATSVKVTSKKVVDAYGVLRPGRKSGHSTVSFFSTAGRKVVREEYHLLLVFVHRISDYYYTPRMGALGKFDGKNGVIDLKTSGMPRFAELRLTKGMTWTKEYEADRKRKVVSKNKRQPRAKIIVDDASTVEVITDKTTKKVPLVALVKRYGDQVGGKVKKQRVPDPHLGIIPEDRPFALPESERSPVVNYGSPFDSVHSPVYNPTSPVMSPARDAMVVDEHGSMGVPEEHGTLLTKKQSREIDLSLLENAKVIGSPSDKREFYRKKNRKRVKGEITHPDYEEKPA